ncbi:ABC transporter ATP-binding protein [Verrucomicrobiales bacterium]|nr:ABC transporter ATP-binding protein [Verrucomicrobiales bacterium]MDB2495577.1 ABC transporter ATP-binding protein [Verrucomicrobiales bacterium]MDC3352940.1 ABC transporter ATP-binding protein [Verrucomicrobiales bacterium]
MTDSAPSIESAVEARDIVRTFQVGDNRIEVLKKVSLDVKRGEKLFLVGPSGAGKTSLLYTLAGLERPNEGDVLIDGRSLYRLRRKEQARVRNSSMGYVFQSFFLMPELTAFENVLVPAMIKRTAAKDKAEELLERVGLADRLHHLPNELSGGEQQRVAIARSLINDPKILFADEPTGNLDTKTGIAVMDLLMELINENERTLLVVTHDKSMAELGDRKVTLVDGRIVD